MLETFIPLKVSIVLQPIMENAMENECRIKEKAQELFMQFGLKSVSMDDIASRLGMSKKTIYQTYADKDALVHTVITSLLCHNQSCCDRDKLSSENAIHEIFLAMDFMMEMFRSMNPSLVYDMQKYYPLAYSEFSKHKHNYLYGVIKSNMERGIAEGLYREDLQVEVLSRFRVESMMLPFDPAFHSRVKKSLADIEEELMIYFLFGMVTPSGYKLATKYRQERSAKV